MGGFTKIGKAFVFALAILAASPAAAQPSPPPDVKAAFLALPEADRKAIQDALGWLGLYNGVVDGGYGKRTIDSLIAYQQSLSATADGIATPKQIESLKAGAAKAKADVGFKVTDDPATGVRYGAPFKLLEKHESAASSTSLASADGEIALYLKQSAGDLSALYKSMAALPNRKVTYKFLKPDEFFVLAGEEGERKFYRRYAIGGDSQIVRGFAFLYPKAKAKTFDRVALAVANAFDPFPSAPTPAPRPTPEPAKLTAVALIVAPGVAVTTLPPAQCKAPTVEGGPVRFLEASASGLTRLAGAFGAGAAAPAVAPASDDLVALSLAPAGPTKAELQVASAAPAPGDAAHVIAAFGPVATGAPLLDRQGRLVAFVAPGGPTDSRGDVALTAPHLTISAQALGAVAASSAAQPSLSAAEIAAKMRRAVIGVYCQP